MSDFKNMEILLLNGKIEVLTGLHIGAGKDDIQIGGIDAPVIRKPGTDEPYIPGSSLKGKLRSLTEWMTNKVDQSGRVHSCEDPDCPVCVVYGSTKDSKGGERGPTRLIVRDATVVGDYYYEDKTENSIDRIKGKATNPRHIERVAPGATFSFSISYKVLKESDRNYFKDVVIKSMGLLEQDYLGGNGSRGYGKIKFTDLEYTGKEYNSIKDLLEDL